MNKDFNITTDIISVNTVLYERTIFKINFGKDAFNTASIFGLSKHSFFYLSFVYSFYLQVFVQKGDKISLIITLRLRSEQN